MKISIALATYNGERWLGEQLDSLARQTLLPCELVVSDDQSTDGTLAVIERFVLAAPFPVRVIPNEKRLGFADNFINALRHCTGDAVAYCDQDDVWSPSKLERCAAAMAGDPNVTVVHHDSEEVDEELRPYGIICRPSGNLGVARSPDRTLHYVPAIGCCMMVRGSAAKLIVDYWPNEHSTYVARTGARGAFSHDQVTLQVALAVGKAAYVSETLIRHRQHSKNTWSLNLRTPRTPKSAEFAGRSAFLQEYGQVQTVMGSMYASMAGRARANGDVLLANHLTRVADHESRCGRFCLGRAELYGAKSTWNRLAKFSNMARTGVYGGIGGTLTGARSALKDFTFALVGPKAPEMLEAARDRLRLNFQPREAASGRSSSFF